MPSDSTQIVRDWYAGPYQEVTASANGSFFESYMHRQLEAPLSGNDRFDRVLELGGNRGEHFPYVRHRFSEYVLTDLEVPELPDDLSSDSRIQLESCDAGDLPYPDSSFDRVIMTCVMHHVDSPLEAAAQMRRVTRPGGVISILVPTDPGTAYRWGREVTSGVMARRRGLHKQMSLVHAVSHHNHFRSIRRQLQHVFGSDEVLLNYRPFRVPSMNMNAFSVWTVVRGA